MQTSKRRDYLRQRWRGSLVAMSMMVAFGAAGTVRAAAFDETLKAPLVRGQVDMKSQGEPLAARYVTVRESEPERLVTDAAFARQRFDFNWQVRRAIDERKPLDALASQGLVSQGNGSYRIEAGEHPQWDDLHVTMAAILSEVDFDSTAHNLIVRGFRPEDLAVLKEYTAGPKPKALAAAETLPISLGFSRAVRKYDKLKLPVPEALITSYLYQRELVTNESNRRWVEGLLKRLDAQRGRILMSIFLEAPPVKLWSPSNLAIEIPVLLNQVRQPNYEAVVTAEAKGVTP